MQKNDSKGTDKAEDNEQVKAGKKAIEVSKVTSGKTGNSKEKDEKGKKDAEAWHNEG